MRLGHASAMCAVNNPPCGLRAGACACGRQVCMHSPQLRGSAAWYTSVGVIQPQVASQKKLRVFSNLVVVTVGFILYRIRGLYVVRYYSSHTVFSSVGPDPLVPIGTRAFTLVVKRLLEWVCPGVILYFRTSRMYLKCTTDATEMWLICF